MEGEAGIMARGSGSSTSPLGAPLLLGGLETSTLHCIPLAAPQKFFIKLIFDLDSPSLPGGELGRGNLHHIILIHILNLLEGRGWLLGLIRDEEGQPRKS